MDAEKISRVTSRRLSADDVDDDDDDDDVDVVSTMIRYDLSRENESD